MPSHSSHQQSGEQPLREPRNAIEHARLYDWLAKDQDLQRALFAFAPITITKPFEIRPLKEKSGYLHLELRTIEPDSAGNYYYVRWHTWTGESHARVVPVFIVARSKQKGDRPISGASEYFIQVPEDLVSDIRRLKQSEDSKMSAKFRNHFGFSDLWPSSDAPKPFAAWVPGSTRTALCAALDNEMMPLAERTLAHRFLGPLHTEFNPSIQTLSSVSAPTLGVVADSFVGRRSSLGFPALSSSAEHAETLMASLTGLEASDSAQVLPLLRAARNISVQCVSELFKHAVTKFGGAPELKDWCKELREFCPHTQSAATISLALKLDRESGAIEPLLTALTRTPLGLSEVRRVATLIQAERPEIVEPLVRALDQHEHNCADLQSSPVVISIRQPKRAATYLSFAAFATCGAAVFGVKEHNRPIFEAAAAVSRAYDSHTSTLEASRLPADFDAQLEKNRAVLKNVIKVLPDASVKELLASCATVTEALGMRYSWILLYTSRRSLRNELASDLAHLQNLSEPFFQDAVIDPIRSRIQLLDNELAQEQERLLLIVEVDSKLENRLESLQAMIGQKALSVQEAFDRAVADHQQQIDTLAGVLRSAPLRTQEEINELMNLKSVKEIARRPLGGVQHSVLTPHGGFRKDFPESELLQEKSFLEGINEKIDTWLHRAVPAPPSIPAQTIEDFEEISALFKINREVSFTASLPPPPVVNPQVFYHLRASFDALRSLSGQHNAIENRLTEEQQRLQRFTLTAQRALELVTRDLNRAGRLR